jgi:hypothetical protein
MMSGYSKRLRQFVAKIEELSLNIKSRLAGYLLENSSRKAVVTCRLVYSKKELASFRHHPRDLSKQQNLKQEAITGKTTPSSSPIRKN